MKRDIALTPAESKRLIAKGFAQWEPVRTVWETGILAVTTGTTNGYVIEELSGQSFNKRTYVTGRTLPATYNGEKPDYSSADYVLRQGERLEMKATDAVQEMSAGDMLVKGVNAINYEYGQAGVLIGHPTGGTLGATLGTVIARGVRLVHPVGLEKCVPGDLSEIAGLVHGELDSGGPALWPSHGELFTEIEAIQTLTGADAVQTAAGGIGGAEGAVRLAVLGDQQQLAHLDTLLEEIHGEPPFI